MTIQTAVNENETVMSLSGWLDTKTAPEFTEAVDALEVPSGCVVFDFAELEYISSAGLRQLVAAHKKLDGNLKIRNASAEIRDILRMAGFDKRLNLE